MLRRGAQLLLVALLAAGCSKREEEPVALPPVDLTNAHRDQGGYPAIIYAQPAASGEAVPQEPLPAGRAVLDTDAEIDEGRDAEPYFRVFPISDEEILSAPLTPSYGTIVLRDGCLRLQGVPGGPPEALIVFPQGTRPYVDEQGYLVIADRAAYTPAPVRIGEGLIFGSAPEVEGEALIASIREACGAGPLLWISRPRSYYGVKLNDIARNAPRVARIRRVSLEEARTRMADELRASEARRRQCALEPEQACELRVSRPAESWLIVLPPPPPDL